jgi:hydrogenase nickel incorporation protein HypA/HybF
MHETALAAGMLRIVREEARRHRVARITEIHLQLGLLSAVETHSLSACFKLLAEGSVAQGAVLEIACAPLPAQCKSCGHRFELLTRSFFCPCCRSADIHFEGGHGCTIQSISVERADSAQESPV